MDAGSCIPLYYYDVANGGVPPAAPNKMTLKLFFDNSGILVRTILNAGAEPANGASFSVCATSDGTSGGSPRAGTYYAHIEATKDNGAGGVGNYRIGSDGSAAVGTVASFDVGGLRAKTIVSSIARNAYPAGSTFAYGPAGDETVTITATFSQPGADNNVETSSTSILDASTLLIGQAGATVDIDATTTLAQGFLADNTFPVTNSPYVPGWTIAGNSGLLGEKWTILAATGHGAGLTRVSDTFIYGATFNIDSRIKLDSTASGGFTTADETDRSYAGGSCSGSQVDLFNRGEMACTSWAVVNARDEYLSRSMTFTRRDTANTVCASYGSLTPSSNIYTVSGSFATSATCLAAADNVGTARHLLVTNTDQSYVSGTIYKLSSLYYVDSHLQYASTLATDDFPTDDATEVLAYEVRGDGLGGDMSQTARQWCHVDGVRQDVGIDTSGSAITRTIKDPTATTRATATTDTDSTGWTPTSQNLLASTPLGDWTALCSVAFNGNTGTDTETFEAFVNATGGGDIYQADPLKAFASYNPASDKVRVAISASYLDGSARTGAAADIYVDAWNEALTQVVTAQNPTELAGTAYGVYIYDFTPATDGIFTVRARTTDPDTMAAITVGNDLLVAQPASFTFNGTVENATLALLLDKLGPQGEPVNIESSTLDFWVPVLLWFAALLFFLKFGKLMAAGAATAGVGLALATGGDLGFMALALVLLVLALWLEATVMEAIYQRWFSGRAGRREAS